MDALLDDDAMTEPSEAPQEHAEESKVAPDRLYQFADAEGDISRELDAQELTALGRSVVEDYTLDHDSIATWRDTVERALSAAAQEKPEAKDHPWPGAANIKYPTLAVAAQQFAARAYPAIVKGDAAVGVKILGKKPDNTQQQQPGQENPAIAAYEAKKRRAERVKDWLNYRLFYGMPDWEADVDALINQLPIVGMAFKKVYKSIEYGVCTDYVSALHVTVHNDTRDLASCPRVTHDYTLYPYEIAQKMRRGEFREVKLTDTDEDKQKPRCILEQHRMHDLDDDGVDEPYIVTVDKESEQVLRIEAAYTRADVLTMGDKVVGFIRFMPFIAFPFMPDPKGGFYGIGFGALLETITEAINSGFNQLIDAGHAQIAGGGFISSGVRLQAGGQTSSLRMKPGEYKAINVTGDLRGSVLERTTPQPSTVMFQMLDMLMAAARDVSAVKDVLTGDAPNNAPVGTTMALIEQGLQQFTAIYKRIYRSLKEEYKLLFNCEYKWGGQEAAEAYADFFDGDPEADFAADFDPKGYDVVPVSDPTIVTKMQQLNKMQFLMQFMEAPFANGPEIMKASLEAADFDEPERFIVVPQGPNPMEVATLEKTKSEANKNNAAALKSAAEAGAVTGEHQAEGAFHAGVAAEQGRVSDLEGKSGDAMGAPVNGAPDSGEPGGMVQPLLEGQPGNEPGGAEDAPLGSA